MGKLPIIDKIMAWWDPGYNSGEDNRIGYIVKDNTTLAVGTSTPLLCTECKTDQASTYYLKRRRGLYSLLCFQNGRGCWERSGRTNCSYVDNFGAECTNLAEYEIVSLDGRSSNCTCLGHIPYTLTVGSPGQQIFPLED